MKADWIQTMRISQLAQAPCIHPTATVSGDVQLEEGASIGPYCVVEGRVKIGVGTKVLAHSVVQGTTFIGAGCRLGPHAAVPTKMVSARLPARYPSPFIFIR